jgi:hypothetical protein
MLAELVDQQAEDGCSKLVTLDGWSSRNGADIPMLQNIARDCERKALAVTRPVEDIIVVRVMSIGRGL